MDRKHFGTQHRQAEVGGRKAVEMEWMWAGNLRHMVLPCGLHDERCGSRASWFRVGCCHAGCMMN